MFEGVLVGAESLVQDGFRVFDRQFPSLLRMNQNALNTCLLFLDELPAFDVGDVPFLHRSDLSESRSDGSVSVLERLRRGKPFESPSHSSYASDSSGELASFAELPDTGSSEGWILTSADAPQERGNEFEILIRNLVDKLMQLMPGRHISTSMA